MLKNLCFYGDQVANQTECWYTLTINAVRAGTEWRLIKRKTVNVSLNTHPEETEKIILIQLSLWVSNSSKQQIIHSEELLFITPQQNVCMLLQYIFKICDSIVCCHKSSCFFFLTTHQVTSSTRTLFLHNLQQEVAFGPSSCDLFVDF